MIPFIEHMIFVCFAGAAVSIALVTMAGIFYLIDHFTSKKFSKIILKLFEE